MCQSTLHKQGDTFFRTCRFKADGTNATPITSDLTISSSVKTATGIYPLTVTILDQTLNPGMYTLQSNDTQGWAIGRASWDIQYINGGVKTSTETMNFSVVKDVTP